MRSRTIIKLCPQLEFNDFVFDEIKEKLKGVPDNLVLKNKYQKSKFRKSVKALEKIYDKEMRESFWEGQSLVVARWVKNKNIKVEFKKRGGNFYSHEEKIIQVDTSIKAEPSFYKLLHECGHCLLINTKSYDRRYPFEKYDNFIINKNMFFIDEKRMEDDRFFLKTKKVEGRALTKKEKKNLHLHSAEYCILRIQEEFEAWDRGLNLAKRLGLEINNENFMKTKFKCLETYLDWSVLERNCEL